MPRHRSLLPLLLLAVPAAAQRTYVVDSAGGAGVDFTDLPPALAVARAGDVVRVRARTLAYSPGTTSHGITLLGDGGPTLTGTTPGMQVRQLPAGQAFVMKGFQCSNAFGTAMTVDACLGRVHVENVQIPTVSASAGVVVQQSAAVTFANCGLQGRPALQATGSKVVLTACRLEGTSWPTSGPLPGLAINANAATVTMSGGAAIGGSGATGQPIPGSSAIMANNGCTLTVGGDSTTSVIAGFSSFSVVPGIRLDMSTLTIDPSVQVMGPPSGGTITTRRIPALTAIGAPPGGNASSTLYTPAGELVVLLIGLPGQPLAVPPFGELWIDPLGILQVIASTQGAGQHWNVNLPLPPTLPRGVVIALQGLSGPGVDLRLSNPSVVIVH